MLERSPESTHPSGCSCSPKSQTHALIRHGNICKDVLSKAGVTETEIKNHPSDFLIKQIKTGPTVTTSFTASTVKAENDKKIVFGVGFYPMYTDRPLFLCCARILTKVS